jgi:aspartyl-tRNA(Asn)/glutamyl-tRNA(Gln) amidotransferase subunit B
MCGSSRANMQQGSMRVDVNINLADAAGGTALTPRVELKNVAAISGLEIALRREIERQRAALASGDAASLCAETRFVDPRTGVSVPGRAKQSTGAYMFMPEPNLPPLVVTDAMMAAAHAAVPELPHVANARLLARLGTPVRVRTLLGLHGGEEYLARMAAVAGDVANDTYLLDFLFNTVLPSCPVRELSNAPPPERVAETVLAMRTGELTRPGALAVLAALIERPGDFADSAITISDIAHALGVTTLRNEAELARHVEMEAAVVKLRDGKHPSAVKAAVSQIVDRVISATGGRADPALTRAIALAHIESRKQDVASQAEINIA